MPLLSPSTPYTTRQRTLRWIVATTIIAVGTSYAIWAAFDCARIQFGYAASYLFAAVFFIGAGLCILGLPLLLYWRTRTSGMALIATGFIMYISFLGCIGILKKLDRVAWQHEPPEQRFGPDQQASIVIYYRHGTSQAEINDFIDKVLERPAEPRHEGRDYPEFVSEYMVLLPSQANGYDGSTVGLRSDASPSDTAAYISSIKADPRVEKVFLNVVPDAIKLDQSAVAPTKRRSP